jgi:hypothetical protein
MGSRAMAIVPDNNADASGGEDAEGILIGVIIAEVER